MKCPSCSTSDTRVIDSRLNQDGDITRRRRECPHCETRFTTYERIEEVMPAVIKKDGRREAFAREKILSGIQKASSKRPITAAHTEALVREIERRVQGFGVKELPSRLVGQLVMSSLKSMDTVAYVRFASVYREFKDVSEFVAELNETPEPVEATDSPVFPFVRELENEGLAQ